MRSNGTPGILLVEDDHEDIEIFTAILAKLTLNVELTTIEDGRLAMQMLSDGECQPDYIFLDLKLPSMDGLELLHEIRGNDALRLVPVVILSAVDNALIIEKCKELGVDAIIAKSSDERPLASQLKNYLKI
jgi:two-component system, response regulator